MIWIMQQNIRATVRKKKVVLNESYIYKNRIAEVEEFYYIYYIINSPL